MNRLTLNKWLMAASALAVLVCLARSGTAGPSGEMIENFDTGCINWTRGIIQATGFCLFPEKNGATSVDREKNLVAAKQEARQILAYMIHGIRIDGATTVGMLTAANDAVSERIAGMVQDAPVIRNAYRSDGTVAVTLEMNLHGGFAQLVLPGDVRQVESITPLKSRFPRAGAAGTETAVLAGSPKSGVYTGLVIDALGVDVLPALRQEIVDEDGQEVFGAVFASREYAVQQGMTGYATDLAAARQHERVRDNPLTVKGLRKGADGASTIVISNADAAKLRGAPEHVSFLKQCRVIVVLDRM